jgi:hypothetical protein
MADTKITGLTRVTSLNDSDLFVVTIDPGTSPLTRSVEKSNAFSATAWTPVLVGTTAAGAGTYSFRVGRYQRVGKIVYITCTIVWTAHTGTGNMYISGLPFTSSSTTPTTLVIYWDSITLAAVGNKIKSLVNLSKTQIDLYEIASGAVSLLPLDTAGSITVSGFYFID